MQWPVSASSDDASPASTRMRSESRFGRQLLAAIACGSGVDDCCWNARWRDRGWQAASRWRRVQQLRVGAIATIHPRVRSRAELCNGHVSFVTEFRASQVHKTLHNHQDQQRRGMPNNTTRLPFVQIARKTPSIRASGQPEPARWGSLGHNRLRLLCSRAAEVAAMVIAIGATACVAYGGTLPSSRSVWRT